MKMKLLTILSTACTALTAFFKWKRTKKREAISEAVHSGDTEAVTKHHHDLLLLFLPLLLMLGLTACVGCVREKLVIVNQPMAPVRLYHEGEPGWWLSDALYEATLLKLEENR